MRFILVALIVVFAVGCGATSPTSPDPGPKPEPFDACKQITCNTNIPNSFAGEGGQVSSNVTASIGYLYESSPNYITWQVFITNKLYEDPSFGYWPRTADGSLVPVGFITDFYAAEAPGLPVEQMKPLGLGYSSRANGQPIEMKGLGSGISSMKYLVIIIHIPDTPPSGDELGNKFDLPAVYLRSDIKVSN